MGNTIWIISLVNVFLLLPNVLLLPQGLSGSGSGGDSPGSFQNTSPSASQTPVYPGPGRRGRSGGGRGRAGGRHKGWPATACCNLNGVFMCYPYGSPSYAECRKEVSPGPLPPGTSPATMPMVILPGAERRVKRLADQSPPPNTGPPTPTPVYPGPGRRGRYGGGRGRAGGRYKGFPGTACCTLNGVFMCYPYGSPSYAECRKEVSPGPLPPATSPATMPMVILPGPGRNGGGGK